MCQVAEAVVAAHESGELTSALASPEAYKAWVKALGKAQKRKGKRLFMPLRVALTGSTHVSPSPSIALFILHSLILKRSRTVIVGLVPVSLCD